MSAERPIRSTSGRSQFTTSSTRTSSPFPIAPGPYALTIALYDAKLAFDIRTEADGPVTTHILSLTPFRRIVKDYFMVCESYYAAIRTATPTQIEAIDMGRRGLHDEGATLLAERLKDKIVCDTATYRRLFTLITALHWKV